MEQEKLIKYISVIGIDGSGHGEVIEHLKKLFPDAIPVKEPYGIMRAVLKPREPESKVFLTEHSIEGLLETRPTNETYYHLMLASRNLLFQSLKDENRLIISDRSHLCTYAYQIYAMGLERYKEDWIKYLKSFIPKDSIHLFLDCEPETAMARKSGQRIDALDEESVGFFRRVNNGYYDLLQKQRLLGGARIIHVDANQDLESVYEQIGFSINDYKFV